MLDGLDAGEITPGVVIVIRYSGPRRPGMPEMLTPHQRWWGLVYLTRGASPMDGSRAARTVSLVCRACAVEGGPTRS